MQEQEVLALIEAAVRPLRTKIENLERQNHQLKNQISSVLPQNNEHQRLRSSSREDRRVGKKDETRDARSPSLKKKEERPAWGYSNAARQENGNYKSPPPVEKNKHKQVAAKISTRPESKERQGLTSRQKPLQIQKKESVEYLSFERPPAPAEHKKIMGGQRFSESGRANGAGSVRGVDIIGGGSSHTNGRNNPEQSGSQEVSLEGESHLSPVSNGNESC